MDDRPVGVLDSGIGGLSVLKAALDELPRESFVYIADDKNMPYGEKTSAQIKKYVFECARFLLDRQAKAIVIACNTATSAAVEDVRRELRLPVVSIEPAIKPALERTTGTVLMLATHGTCALERYQSLKRRLDTDGRVIDVPCPELASRVERGDFSPDAFDDLFDEYITEYVNKHPEAVVLGCTHYPFVKPQLAAWFARHGCRVQFFAGAAGTARQLARVLEKNGLESAAAERRVELFSTSGENRQEIMRKLLFN